MVVGAGGNDLSPSSGIIALLSLTNLSSNNLRRLCNLLLVLVVTFKAGAAGAGAAVSSPVLLVEASSNTRNTGRVVSSLLTTRTTSSTAFRAVCSSSSSTFLSSAFAIHHRRRSNKAAPMSSCTELKYKSLEDHDYYYADREQFHSHNGSNFQEAGERLSGDDIHEQDNDYSTTSSSSYNPGLYYDEEWQENNIRRLSTVSNTIFLSAGIMYLATSTWDINPPFEDDSSSSKAFMIYTLLGNLAPVTYLINSLFDIRLANSIRKAQKIKRMNQRLSLTTTTTTTSPSTDHDTSFVPNANSRNEHLTAEIWDDNDTFSLSHDTLKTSFSHNDNDNNPQILNASPRTRYSKSSFKRVRKYAAHRREFTAAFTFFFAALFSVLPIIIPLSIGISDEEAFTIFDGISVHTYMLSSIFALMGSIRTLRHLDWDLGKADTLETLGDLLFFGGSMVDLILFDFHFDDGAVGWPIFSSTLWCVDALLYLNSDWVASKMLKSRQDIIV